MHFLIELCELTLILLSPLISYESVQMLKVMISSHLKQFKELFPEKKHYSKTALFNTSSINHIKVWSSL